jgi:hypothetical protein
MAQGTDRSLTPKEWPSARESVAHQTSYVPRHPGETLEKVGKTGTIRQLFHTTSHAFTSQLRHNTQPL